MPKVLMAISDAQIVHLQFPITCHIKDMAETISVSSQDSEVASKPRQTLEQSGMPKSSTCNSRSLAISRTWPRPSVSVVKTRTSHPSPAKLRHKPYPERIVPPYALEG